MTALCQVCSNGLKIVHTYILIVSEVLGASVPFNPKTTCSIQISYQLTQVSYIPMICTRFCGELPQLIWTCTYNQPLLCCNYLQAVPCDPAGADFNFAALSFNSEFLHQIHLIPLHGCSPAETQAASLPSAAPNAATGLKERRSAG